MRPDCPDEGILQSFIDRELVASEAEHVSNHLHVCLNCQNEVQRIAAEDSWLGSILHQESDYIHSHCEDRLQSLRKAIREDRPIAVTVGLVMVITLLYYLVGSTILNLWVGPADQLLTWVYLIQDLSWLWEALLKILMGSAIFHELWSNLSISATLWTVLFAAVVIKASSRFHYRDLKSELARDGRV
ncbi:MAG: hypothetical protein ACM3MK_03045 [Chitinophagales bacterium]